jgi:squalene-hopene/tetraprenyl-beta-curcumene cyclase
MTGIREPQLVDYARLRVTYEKVREELLAERTSDGHWVGELSSSALSTATAISALAVVRRPNMTNASTQYSVLSTQYSDAGRSIDNLIERGVSWLVKQQNTDGGFGDTDLSHSNIATTYLAIAALHLAGVADQHAELIVSAKTYIDSKNSFQGLRERYGIDKTFVVPILTNLALAGLVDWSEIEPLPFELACVPQSWYRFVGMPVVSYAIPALVAIGQARFHHAPPRNPITRIIRTLSISRSLKVLRRMQPDSGGYLEATPLTSFVVMSLASMSRPLGAVSDCANDDQTATTGRGFGEEVIRDGVKFLTNSARPDGSWPIDTNLATWNTTLSINALAGAGENVAELLGSQCLDWLLSCQHTKRHPFTGANRGGFGWSDLSGAVPDADDTPGAMLAISKLAPFRNGIDNTGQAAPIFKRVSPAMLQSLWWLSRLRNRDGGWPTFCRGWGKLPFDRSGVDLTAHALRAIAIFFGRDLSTDQNFDVRKYSGINKSLKFIERNQHPDGSWSPLWFGNQDHPNEENPVYGTAKVVMAYRDLGLLDSPEVQLGVAWLVVNQNEDGGWGSGVWGKVPSTQCPVLNTANDQSSEIESSKSKSKIPNLKSSIEETALAVEALLAGCPRNATEGVPYSAVAKGLNWLIDRVETAQHRQPAPIGFYFAKLWYYERLYPLIFTVAALGRACRQFAPPADNNSTAATSDFRAS